MAPEIRNLKGEIVQDPDNEGQWYHLSANTWFLVGGLLLFNIGCFFNPNFMDYLFRFLDFRLWSWWYFLVLLLIVAFSIKWYILFQSWDDLDPVDIDVGKQFLLMSITITAELLILVLLHVSGLARHIGYSLWTWFSFGSYSHGAALAFLLICAAIAITYYVVKEWFIVKFQS